MVWIGSDYSFTNLSWVVCVRKHDGVPLCLTAAGSSRGSLVSSSLCMPQQHWAQHSHTLFLFLAINSLYHCLSWQTCTYQEIELYLCNGLWVYQSRLFLFLCWFASEKLLACPNTVAWSEERVNCFRLVSFIKKKKIIA